MEQGDEAVGGEEGGEGLGGEGEEVEGEGFEGGWRRVWCVYKSQFGHWTCYLLVPSK